MEISIIIPTYNEADNIKKLISHLIDCSSKNAIEIIVSDGNSTDSTIEEAKKAGAKVTSSPKKGRAAQMNFAANLATGDILYFLHADSYPPDGFCDEIIKSVKCGIKSGCFWLSFDYDHWFLKFNCWFTQLNFDSFRFGDQSLFVSKDIFHKCGEFDESLIVMEDNEIIKRIRKYTGFTVIKKRIKTSARKYLVNGIYKLQFIFGLLYLQYRMGYSQKQILENYKKLISQDKI